MKKQPPIGAISVTSFGRSLPAVLSLPLIGGRACLDFVNTWYWRHTPTRSTEVLLSYSDVLAFALRADLISSDSYTTLSRHAADFPEQATSVFREAISFRATLTAFLEQLAQASASGQDGESMAASLSLLSAIRRRVRASESLVWSAGHLGLSAEDEGLNHPWFQLVRDAEELLLSPHIDRLRLCAAEGCGRVFLDSSKNGSRRWCSMQSCGNRIKAARFRARS